MRISAAVFAVWVLVLPCLAGASTEVGRLAVINGDVRVTKSEAEAGAPAKANDPVFNDDIIRTGEAGAAKVLFSDQSLMDVGPNSAMKISQYALRDGENRTGTFSILYGKLRALVTRPVGKGGKVEVRTKDAVMGVRGTEFVVDVPKGAPPGAGTSVVVVSGLVTVQPPKGGPEISVGAGQMVVATPKTFAQAAEGGGSGTSGAGSKSDEKKEGSTTLASDSKDGDGGAKNGDSGGSPVVQVSAEEMKSTINTAKVEDNTFIKTVDISGEGPGSGPGTQKTGAPGVPVVQIPPPMSETGGGPKGPPLPAMPPNFLPPGPAVPIGGFKVSLTVNVQ